MVEEKRDEEKKIASIQLLNAVQANVEEQPHARMYVETEIKGKSIKALVDTGADTMYMAKELADEMGLVYMMEKGYFMGVNANSLPIDGVARDTPIRIGQWQGKADITIAPIDDKKFDLGIDFIDKVKAFLVPYANTMCIMEKGQPCVVLVIREIDESKMLCALQHSKGLKKKEPTFIATLKMNEVPKDGGKHAPKAIQKVLEEFKDVMPTELPKKLPPRREVDHAIELELGAKPPAFAPYRMAPRSLKN